MHKNRAEATAFAADFLRETARVPGDRELVLCAPFTALGALVAALASSRVKVGAQNVHWEDAGAFTGEISAPMLVELGVTYAIVGHSERRQFFGETDETVNYRLRTAQKHGLVPILCVGESKQQRDAGETEAIVTQQLKQGLVGVDQTQLVIAYEPIWAIGTGDTCAANEANRVIGLIRSLLHDKTVPVQYGGSVKAGNVDEIMAQSEIDGALVGGASLDVESFARIANYQ